MCKKYKDLEAKSNALEHAIAWGIQSIFTLNARGKEILEDKEMDEKEKIVKVHGPDGTDYQILNLILLLKPMIEHAKASYPEYENFFEWYDDRWKTIEEKNLVKGPCNCKGCKTDKPDKKEEPKKEA